MHTSVCRVSFFLVRPDQVLRYLLSPDRKGLTDLGCAYSRSILNACNCEMSLLRHGSTRFPNGVHFERNCWRWLPLPALFGSLGGGPLSSFSAPRAVLNRAKPFLNPTWDRIEMCATRPVVAAERGILGFEQETYYT